MNTATTVKIPDVVQHWIDQFIEREWSGSLTLHFNRGSIQSYEPKPNLRTDVK